jgi:hypothetical protein
MDQNFVAYLEYLKFNRILICSGNLKFIKS